MSREHELAGSVAGGCFLLMAVMVIVIALTGCVEHRISSPQLETITNKLASVQACPTLDIPPIPQQVHLTVEGEKINADAGGRLVLAYFVYSRNLLRGAK